VYDQYLLNKLCVGGICPSLSQYSFAPTSYAHMQPMQRHARAHL